MAQLLETVRDIASLLAKVCASPVEMLNDGPMLLLLKRR